MEFLNSNLLFTIIFVWLVTAAIKWYRDRKAHVSPDGHKHLSPDMITPVLFISFSAFFGWAAMKAWETGADTGVFTMFLAISIGSFAAVIAELVKSANSVYFDEKGIYIDKTEKEVLVSWDEITEVGYNRHERKLEIRSKGEDISVYQNSRGIKDLIKNLENKVSSEIIGDSIKNIKW